MSATVGLFEHFKRLADFKGREDRGSFWPYAALVYGIMTAGSFVAMLPLMNSVTSSASQAASDGNPPAFPDVGSFFIGIAVMTAVGVLLYAAAVARRLHDGGLSGFWGLMPLPFLVFGMVRMRSVFGSIGSGSEPDMAGFQTIFINNFIYILTVIALIILLARRSDPASNRFDENPSPRA
jgi:uncharacterized membrane protein YhaH (DUF805 family)